MNIKKHLSSILNNKDIINLTSDKKVYFIHANNPTPPYIEYQVLTEHGADFSEGKENYTYYLVQIDIFSKGDYTNLEDNIKKYMSEAGYSRDNAADLYEKETKLYHKAMRFNISLPFNIEK
ncbi:MAG: hypothetical protein ACRDBY_05295 [Cetobacterium sp.]